MLQLRPRGSSDPFYAPHRDMAYVSHHLVARAMRQLDQLNWGELKRFFDLYGVTEADLGVGAQVLADFFNNCTNEQDDTQAHAVLERVGFFKLPFPVQVGLMYVLGQQYACAFFVCIREVTHLGEKPPVDMATLVAAADAAAGYMNLPRWRRWLKRTWHGARAWLLAKLGGPGEPEPKLPPGTRATPAALHTAAIPQGAVNEPLPEALPKPGIRPEV